MTAPDSAQGAAAGEAPVSPQEAAERAWQGTGDWEMAVEAALSFARQSAPRCPNGCGCVLGTGDADARDCACDGLCCYDEIEIEALFRERDQLKAQLAAAAAQPGAETVDLSGSGAREVQPAYEDDNYEPGQPVTAPEDGAATPGQALVRRSCKADADVWLVSGDFTPVNPSGVNFTYDEMVEAFQAGWAQARDLAAGTGESAGLREQLDAARAAFRAILSDDTGDYADIAEHALRNLGDDL